MCELFPDTKNDFIVLTLLILEFGLGAFRLFTRQQCSAPSLNPSYTGIWSRGAQQVLISTHPDIAVLTLLILEFGLGAFKKLGSVQPW